MTLVACGLSWMPFSHIVLDAKGQACHVSGIFPSLLGLIQNAFDFDIKWILPRDEK